MPAIAGTPNLGPGGELAAAFQREVDGGERFEFGRNWRRFLSVLDDARIVEAERALAGMLGRARLDGLRFLDVGSGSGLHSLAARRLGARVHSFDYDPSSVACTRHLRRSYRRDDDDWTVEHGSALDAAYLEALGRFDVVYAWGVLHHTGAMWRALDHVDRAVGDGGVLFVSLYNDQGWKSQQWRRVKRLYCSGRLGRALVSSLFVPGFAVESALVDVLRARSPLERYRSRERGMSVFHDWLDWLGGYPFEVASPGEVLAFQRRRGFSLERLETRSSGCNEYVFVRR